MLDKKFLLLIIIGGASLVLFSFSIIRPQQMQLKKVQLELEKKEAFCSEYETLPQVLNYLQEEKAALNQAINCFLGVEEKEETNLVIPNSLIDIFKKSKVELVSITPLSQAVKGNLLISSWKIDVLADYHELSYLVSTIERSAGFNRIDSLTISSEENSGKYKALLTVSKIVLRE